MRCKNCDRPIERIVTRENRLVWRHTYTMSIFCAVHPKAEPDVPIEQTEAWDLPAQEAAEHNQRRET